MRDWSYSYPATRDLRILAEGISLYTVHWHLLPTSVPRLIPLLLSLFLGVLRLLLRRASGWMHAQRAVAGARTEAWPG